MLGHQKASDFRNSFGTKLKRLVGLDSNEVDIEEFWALKNISFQIRQGEAVGIIGRNGAGKSTLLKILSRITEPTTGRFELQGRVSSLLEVGTGFHMELTGRENIYLNGTILGMKRAEIKQKFDEIVSFSGIEKFIDTPVKHYSSGMKVRLAFSVAAHLEPEILIVDEVLAVGDAEFQKKCLGKMDEVSKNRGRTVIFVSHNLAAVERLCNKGIYLKNGAVNYIGSASETLKEYSSGRSWPENKINIDHEIVRSIEVSQIEDKLLIRAYLDNYNYLKPPFLGFNILDSAGNKLFGSNPKLSGFDQSNLPFKKGYVETLLSDLKLRNGVYYVSVWIGDGVYDFFEGIECLSVHIKDMIDNKYHPEVTNLGPVFPEASWKIIKA